MFCRATLLLVPLLGLQYILTPFRPEAGNPYEAVYEGKFNESWVFLYLNLRKSTLF